MSDENGGRGTVRAIIAISAIVAVIVYVVMDFIY